MKTIVTHVHLKPDAGRDWDAAMRRRLSAARKRPGWVGGQLLRPADYEDKRAEDLLTRVQAARASSHEAWVTTRIDGRLVVETDRPR